MTDAGVHNIAALRDIFGEIKSGVAFTRSVNPAIGKMDSMSFSFVFESGVNGIFNLYFSAQGIDENRLMIFGKGGTLVIAENKIVLKRRGKPDVAESVRTDGGYQRQFEDFYDCIVNGKEPVSTFHEAYKDFRTILAALDSANKWEMHSLY